MKNLLLLPLLFLSIYSRAQTLPNAGFENWHLDSTAFANWVDPNDWTTPNFFSALNGFQTVEPTTDTFSGDSAARLLTLPLGLAGVPLVAYLISGSATTNATDGSADAISAGVPTSSKFRSVNGWYKFESEDEFDTGALEVILKKWNSASGQRDTVGYILKFLPQTTEEYTFFNVNIVDLKPGEVPDSVVVAFYSTQPNVPRATGKLWVDEVSMSLETAILSSEALSLSVFPNPAQAYLQIEGLPSGQYAVVFWNLAGEMALEQPIIIQEDQQAKIYTDGLSSGIYLLEIQDQSGVVARKKVLLQP